MYACYCSSEEASKPSHALRISVMCAVLFEHLIDLVGPKKKKHGKGFTEKNIFNAHMSGLIREVPWMCKIFPISELHTETGEQFFQLCNLKASNTKCSHQLALQRMLYRHSIVRMIRATSQSSHQAARRVESGKSSTLRHETFVNRIKPNRDADEDGKLNLHEARG